MPWGAWSPMSSPCSSTTGSFSRRAAAPPLERCGPGVRPGSRGAPAPPPARGGAPPQRRGPPPGLAARPTGSSPPPAPPCGEGRPPDQAPEALADLDRRHEQFVATALSLPEEDWERKGPVYYGTSEDALPTSPADISGWLQDHYREHVPQVAELYE